jgi:hypothetical protein
MEHVGFSPRDRGEDTHHKEAPGLVRHSDGSTREPIWSRLTQ